MIYLILFLILLILIGVNTKRVPVDQRLVVYRFGRPCREAGPGIVLLVPVLERAESVTVSAVREFVELSAIRTRDGALLRMGVSVTYAVVSPLTALQKVFDPKQAIIELTKKSALQACRELARDSALGQPRLLAGQVETLMAPTVQSWGLELQEVSIRDILPL